MTEPEHESPDAFLAAHRKRRAWSVAAGLAVAIAITGAIFWFVATRKVKPKRPPADAEPAPMTADVLDDKYVALARKEAIEALGAACDEDAANTALKRLAQDDDWEGVMIVGNGWLGRCPADEQVRWKLFKALEELERWPEAVAEATRLIAMNPTDVDYWWWRGKARKEAGDVAGSAIDYRQSIALAELSSTRGINIMGYADVAPVVGRACDAAFAMRWYGHRNGGDVNSAFDRKLASVAEFGSCTEAIGRGRTELTMDAPPSLRLGAATFPATIDHHVPYVVIDEAAATAAGLDLAGAQAIEIVIDERREPARLVRATVMAGPLAADDVEVAVIAGPRAPAILGLGFWWRFDWGWSGEDERSAGVTPIADPGAL